MADRQRWRTGSAKSRRFRALALATVAATLAYGCSSGTPSSQPPSSAPPPTAWDTVVDQIGADGTVSLDTALQAFTLAVGPLPGVSTPPGPTSTIASATGPIRWVLMHWDELAPEQQQAFDAYFPEPLTGSAAPPGVLSLFRPGPPGGLQLASLQQDLEALRDEIKPQIATLLHRDVLAPITIILTGKTKGTAHAGTWATGDHGAHVGPLSGCRIYIYPDGQALTGAERKSMLGHEIFHCFQRSLGKVTDMDSKKVAPWVVEGEGAWVGETIAGGSSNSEHWWEYWLTLPELPLFKRAYSAIGLYGHLSQYKYLPSSWPTNVDGSVGALLDGLLESAIAGGSDAAYSFLVASTGDDMLDSWGPAYIRDKELGKAWDFAGPGITEAWAVPESISVGNSQTAAIVLPVPAYAALAVKVDLTADVAIVGAAGLHGLVRFSSGSDTPLSAVSDQPLCTRPDACTCPAESPGANTAFMPVSSGLAHLGATGHTTGGDVALIGYALDDFCQTREEGLVDPCLVGTWESAPWTLGGFDAIAPGMVDTLAGGDGVRVTFTTDAREIIDFSQMADLTSTVHATDLDMAVTARFDGSMSFRVSSHAGELRLIPPPDSTVTMTASADTAGQHLQILDHKALTEMAESIGGSLITTEGDVSYTCGSATLQMPLSSRAESVTWTRVP